MHTPCIHHAYTMLQRRLLPQLLALLEPLIVRALLLALELGLGYYSRLLRQPRLLRLQPQHLCLALRRRQEEGRVCLRAHVGRFSLCRLACGGLAPLRAARRWVIVVVVVVVVVVALVVRRRVVV